MGYAPGVIMRTARRPRTRSLTQVSAFIVGSAVASAQGGCYLEARGHGQLVGNAGAAVSEAMLGATVSVGIELPVGSAPTQSVRAGVGAERVMANGTSQLAHQQAPDLELGYSDVWSSAAVDAHFAIAGFVPSSGNISELQLALAAAFGTDTVRLFVGPSIGYWDAARRGVSVGAGVDFGMRLRTDPRPRLDR